MSEGEMGGPVLPTSIRLDRYDRAFIKLAGPRASRALLAPRLSQSDLVRYLIRVGAQSLGVTQDEVLAAVRDGEVE